MILTRCKLQLWLFLSLMAACAEGYDAPKFSTYSRRIVEQAQLLEDGAIIQRRWQLQGPGIDRSWLAWHRLYSVDALCAMLQQAGFSRTSVYGALDKRPFSPAGDGAVVLAER